jgi:hypothetical protein
VSLDRTLIFRCRHGMQPRLARLARPPTSIANRYTDPQKGAFGLVSDWHQQAEGADLVFYVKDSHKNRARDVASMIQLLPTMGASTRSMRGCWREVDNFGASRRCPSGCLYAALVLLRHANNKSGSIPCHHHPPATLCVEAAAVLRGQAAIPLLEIDAPLNRFGLKYRDSSPRGWCFATVNEASRRRSGSSCLLCLIEG